MNKISKKRKELLLELEQKLGYTFSKLYLLDRALTHSSYANQEGLSYVEHNERLEFLGDSVLSIVISEHIFKKYKTKPEGKLTRIRAGIVCESSLYECAKGIDLGKYMLIGKGEEMTGGRTRVSILADAFEAVIAAIYIDGGLDKVRDFVIRSLSKSIKGAVKDRLMNDYKTELQEIVQREQGSIIEYKVTGEDGPDHDKVFYVAVDVNGRTVGNGHGKSKKEAEQEAAKSAISLMGGKK